jgi:Tol biopolymer transport system component
MANRPTYRDGSELGAPGLTIAHAHQRSHYDLEDTSNMHADSSVSRATITVARAWGKPDRYQDLKTGLYVLRSDGSAPRLVAAFGYSADVGGATWSPDGHRLVFSVLNNGPGRPSGASALFTVSASGRGRRRITDWDTAGQIASPGFSPDGELVLFQIKPSGQDFGGNDDLFVMHADGTHISPLTRTAPWESAPTWMR